MQRSHSPYEIANLEEFEIGEEIEKTSTATIFKGIFKEKMVAIKKVRFGFYKLSKSICEIEIDTLQILTEIKAPNIAYLHGFFSISIFYYILFDYCERGRLDKIIDEQQPYSAMIRLKILIDISKALIFLHEYHMVHRDLDTANILIANNYDAKLTSFGLAKIIDNQIEAMLPNAYSAPEINNKRLPYLPISDIYSFGVVMKEVLVWERPPENPSEFRLQSEKLNIICSSGIVEVINSCRHENRLFRPKAHEILKSLEIESNPALKL